MNAQKKPFVKPVLRSEASLADVTLQTGANGGDGTDGGGM
jgi:hypothetical protein